MYGFKTYLEEEKDLPEITEEELDGMVNSLSWEDIQDLYDEEEFVDHIKEDISAVERIKRGQRMRSRKFVLAMAKNIKLKRNSPLPVLQKRAKLAARKMIYKRLLQKRDKSQLSAQDKNMIETRAKRILKMYKNLPQKLMPKIREIEKQRLANR